MKISKRFSLCLSAILIFSSITGVQFLVSSDTFAQAPTPPSPLDVADSIYNSNTSTFVSSKNISSTPYRMTDERYSEHGILKGVGNVTNNETFINTYLTDELTQGRGNGTIETQDGQSITWISSDIGRFVDGEWDFYGIMLFNDTQSGSLSILNNSIALSRDTTRLNEPDYIWILE